MQFILPVSSVPRIKLKMILKEISLVNDLRDSLGYYLGDVFGYLPFILIIFPGH